jgi:hypothetical protein
VKQVRLKKTNMETRPKKIGTSVKWGTVWEEEGDHWESRGGTKEDSGG